MRKTTKILGLCLLGCLLAAGQTWAQTQPTGSGTQDDPYRIGTEDELFWFAGLVNGTLDGVAQNAAASAVLTDNITIPSDESGTYNWTPIGTSSTPYTGTFDGNGYTIEGMKIYIPDANYQGFVGYLGSGGKLQNLTLGETCSVTVTGSYSYVGGVCGYSTGAVSGDSQVGGVCGYSSGIITITNCYWLDTAYETGTGEGTSTDVLSKTADQFASGEVCYLLNEEISDPDANAWYQTLGEGGDKTPVLDSTHGTVYAELSCVGTLTGNYANSEFEVVHDYDKDGFCTVCGGYQPAEQNEEGVYEISNAGNLFWFAALVNGGTN